MIDEMIEQMPYKVELGTSTHFQTLDPYFKWKKGEINTWLTNHDNGSTTVILSLLMAKAKNDNWKWVLFVPSYSPNALQDKLVEMYAGATAYDQKSLDDALQFIANHFYIFDGDAKSLAAIHKEIEQLQLTTQIDGVLIDKISDLSAPAVATYREDEYYSLLFSDAKPFAFKHQLSYNFVSAVKGTEQPAVINTKTMIVNKSDNIIIYAPTNVVPMRIKPEYWELHFKVCKVKYRSTGGKTGSTPTFLYSTNHFKLAEFPY